MVVAAFVAPFLLPATARFVAHRGAAARRPAGGGHHRAGGAGARRSSPSTWPGTGGSTTPSTRGRSPRRSPGWPGSWARCSGWSARWSSSRCRWRRSARRWASPAWTSATAQNVRDKSRMKTVLRAAGVPCARHQLVTDPDERAGVRRRGRLPAGREAAGRGRARRRPTGSTTTTPCAAGSARCRRGPRPPGCSRSSWSARSTRSTASASAGGRCGRRSRTTCRRRWTCCATRGSSGRCCCRARWTTRGTPPSRTSGRRRCEALGVRDGLTHMEWFRRPDGSVAVSEVGARPPGAQISSMLGYVHDVDFYRLWARAGDPRPVRPAGAEVRRGHGLPARAGPAARVRAVHGVDGAAAPARAPRRRGRLPRAGPAGVVELRGRGVRDRPAPGDRGGAATRCGRSSTGSGSSWWRSSDDGGHALPGLPRRDGLLHPGAGRGRRPGDRRRRPAAVRAAGRRPRRARALRARLAGRRGRGARRAARAVPARPVRPGRVPVGAVHDPRGADPGGVRAARA